MVAIVAALLVSTIALRRMPVDIFPDMGVPVIYVAQPYGGMDPAQMEGLLTNYYEYHFLYVTGIEHVESKNIQGLALIKLFFHEGTKMPQAMSEVIAHVNRSRAFMPPGTVPPFVMRYDAGSVPVGFLVLSSETRSLGEVQDLALFRVRPMFASLPGVSAPPPFGGSQRTIVIRLDPDRLRALCMSPEEVAAALSAGNAISPSGNIRVDDLMPIVRVNSVVPTPPEFGQIAIRPGAPPVYLRDVATVEDGADISTGFALVDGRRTIYIPVTKRSDASTLSVVNHVKAAMPKMQAAIPDDIHVTFEFDQSPYVTGAIRALILEALLGAVLTGATVLVFLRDWRSVLIVVLNIPFALLGAVCALWLTGQTVNIMTIGGLALAVGILVDEATVAIENIHAHAEHATGLARAVLDGSTETTTPRFLSMLCVIAVFIPSLFMVGAARAMFVPLSLAVGFSMIFSYLLSSTFVPVACIRLLRHHAPGGGATQQLSFFTSVRVAYRRALGRLIPFRWIVAPGYLAVAVAFIAFIGAGFAIEIFPTVDTGQFQLRFRAPDGTRIERTESIANRVLETIRREVGAGNVEKVLGYVGAVTPNYPINSIYLWMGGPQEGVLRVKLRPGAVGSANALKERLRKVLAQDLPEVQFSFESGDIISDVMSFGSPTPVEVAVTGPDLAVNVSVAGRIKERLAAAPSLRDLQFAQSLKYPTVDVTIDRLRAGFSGVAAAEVARSLIAATSSSRYTVPNFWPDPKTGIGYQVQLEIPEGIMDSPRAIETIPVKNLGAANLLLRDVAKVSSGQMPGEYDRYNMRRMVTLTGNVADNDLGKADKIVSAAIRDAGELPKGVNVEVRGQLAPLDQMLTGLSTGLGMAIVVILLLLTAYFQSVRLAGVVVATIPAILAGVAIALLFTRTTLNVQSFMGAIMAVGVGVANAILMVTFVEQSRRRGATVADAVLEGAAHRLRPILMTSSAMIAGMIPIALGFGESGEQSAPLGRAAIGGLATATLATLFVIPAVYAIAFRGASTRSASLDPDDPASVHYDPARWTGG